MSKRSDLEERALKLILENGDEGILQRDMWRALGATSREGSRLSLKLEANDLITRERELANGRWTFRLFINIRRIDIDSLLDVPCFFCEDIENCEVGRDISAATCDTLTAWLLSTKEQGAQHNI
jgi:hypothetical protein